MSGLWWPRLQRVGAPPVFRGGFEFHPLTGRVDVQQCLRATDGEHAVPSLKRWPAEVDICWIELDHESRTPSYFFSLERCLDKRSVLEELETEVPWDLENLAYVGLMSGRPGRATRLVLDDRVDKAERTLRDFGWNGSKLSLLGQILPECNTIRTCLDLCDGKCGSPVGFEFRPPSTHIPGILEKARTHGLLEQEHIELVNEWPGLVPPTSWWVPPPKLRGDASLPIYRRTVSHFKLIFTPPNSWSFKIYLHFELEEWKGDEFATLQKARTNFSQARSKMSTGDRELVRCYLNGSLPEEFKEQPELWHLAYGIRWWMRFLSRSSGRDIADEDV